MKHVIQVLETNVNPRTNLNCDLSYKEGILYVVGSLKETILNSEVQKDMETFMIKYVMSEINNENNIIRFRVVWLLGIYGYSVYSDSMNIRNIIKYLCDRLGDNEIPIQVAAGISLESFISRTEAKEIIKPCLDKIVERYLLLIEKVNQRQLINALREIIIIFKNDLAHLVEKLVELLTNAFFIANSKEEFQMEEEKVEDEEEEDENDEGKKEEKIDNFKFVPIAEGYLILILEIVKSQTSKEILDQLENIIMALLRYCLSDEGIEYVEYGLRILLPFLSQTETISENMWEFYPQLNYIFGGTKDPAPPKPDVPSPDGKVDQFKQMMEKFEAERKAKGCLGYADDFSDLIVPCLQNYIQKGEEIILTEKDPVFGLTYVGLLFRTIDKIKLKGSVDTVILHTLYFALLENYRGRIDELMLQILEKSLDELLACKEYITQASLAETVRFSILFINESTRLCSVSGIIHNWLCNY